MNIVFNKLCKDYAGVKVFENISGSISDNNIIGLIGGNGVGKTTLAQILSCQEEYDNGDISYSPNNLKILYLNPEIESKDTVLEHLKKFAAKNADEKYIREIANEINFDKMKVLFSINELSGGEKTKLMLLRAYISEYDILV